MATKVVLYYNQLQSGFSETYYNPSNDPATLSASIGNAFYQACVKFRSTDTILKAARFSSTLPPRNSILVRPYPTAQGASGSGTEVGPDVVSTTAVFQLASTSNFTRRVYLRGLADVDVRRDIFGNDTPSAALIAGTNTMFGALFASGMSIRKGVRPPDAGLAWTDASQIDVASVFPAEWSDITLFGNPAYTVGQQLVVSGAESTQVPRFPRMVKVLSSHVTGGNQVIRVNYALPGGVSKFVGGMRFTPSATALAVISLWYFERFSEHKTGRPFGSLRGRARAV